ncbi:MAG TPA: hypothetical protein VE915_00535 [Actinomycetota bacterium]|nr:hypothetical protein [Actinomycetota bacterium]
MTQLEKAFDEVAEIIPRPLEIAEARALEAAVRHYARLLGVPAGARAHLPSTIVGHSVQSGVI